MACSVKRAAEPDIPPAKTISRRPPSNANRPQRAFLDLLLDRRIPRIAAAQFGLIEPDFLSGCAKCIADAARGVCVI